MMNALEKEIVMDLYHVIEKRDIKSIQILDILDVLLQVDKRLDNEKYPERLINKLTQYIRITASTGKVKFTSEEEKLTIQLSVIGQKAGLNGAYMADFSDKSQFYKFGQQVPCHNH
ncbi:MAG: bacteriocin immunity protein [Lactococcus sp.]|nr:bacteriocin immunity protein [Lactococcus sp.]